MSAEPPHDSIRLIRASQRGDARALEQLVARTYDRVARLVRARVGPWLREVESIEDLVQETYLAAVRDFDRFELREETELIAWLARLAENRIRNAVRHHRAQRRDRRREVRASALGIAGASSSPRWAAPSPTTAPPERAARAELRRELGAALRALPACARRLVLLREHGTASWEELARRLGLPSGEAARKLHARARGRLAEVLRRRLA